MEEVMVTCLNTVPMMYVSYDNIDDFLFCLKQNKKMLTGNRDVDMEIMQQLDDRDLINLCLIDQNSRNICNTEMFWMNRVLRKISDSVLRKFPDLDLEIAKLYKGDRTWKDYYIKDLRRVTGDDMMLIQNSERGRLDRVIIGIKKGADIHVRYEEPLRRADIKGHVDVVAYIVTLSMGLDV